MKKVLSLVLVIAMVLSSMSFAFAGTFTDVADTDYEKAISTLVGLGVITGYEDGTYRPEKVVTRAEMAKLIVEILGYGDLVAGSKSNFTDTQGHWADSWIALAAGRGLVVGTGDGKFTPDRTVSYDEAITMVVRALGYTDASNELKNMTWPTNFKVKAAELGLTKDVKLASTGADRGGVAQLLYNALLVNMVTVTTDGDVQYVKNGDINKVLLHSLALDRTITVNKSMLDKKSKSYKGDIVDLAPYMYQKVDVYVTKDKNEYVVYVAEVKSDVLKGEFRKTGSTTDGAVNVRIDGKNKAYDLATTFSGVYYNGVEVSMNEAAMETGTNPVNLHKAEATFVLNDAKEITGIVATKYTDVARVSGEYVKGKTVYEGFKLPLDDDDKVDASKLTVKGAVDSLEDIKEDDVIVLFAGAGVRAKTTEADKLTIEVVRKTVEGKVTRVDSADGKYYIDGTSYSLSGANGAINTLDLGDEGIFFLDQKGDIVEFDGSVVGPTNYAVVIGKADGTKETKFSQVSIKDYPQLKLATQDDETLVYDIQVKINSTSGVITSAAKDKNGNDIVTGNLSVAGVTANQLIKYSLNKDGKISKIENLGTIAYSNIDLEKTTNKLSKNAVIFDATAGEFDVVDAKDLPKSLDAHIVRNKVGEIEVLVAKAGEISSATGTYAYITKVDNSYDKNGDQVQTVTVYTKGQKQVIQTTGQLTVANGAKKVYVLKYDGADIDDAVSKPLGAAVTASAINVKGGMIQLAGGNWTALAEDATIIGVDMSDDTVNDIRDLNDITKGVTKIHVFYKGDVATDEIQLIIIEE